MSINIMIVDDDMDDIDIFIDAVHEVEPTINCVSAQNGAEALGLIRDIPTRPDYVFVDLNMPKINGRQFIKELRKDHSFDGVKIIVYSTSKLEKDKAETRQLGADGFVTKPTSHDTLCRNIATIIEKDFLSGPK